MAIPEALNKLEKGYVKDCIRNILKQSRAYLFDFYKLWVREKLKCINLLGVLQYTAYWNRKLWDKYIPNIIQ